MAVFTRTLWRQADSWGNAADPGPVCAAQANEAASTTRQWLVVGAGKTNINSLLSPLVALQLNFPFAGQQRVDLLEDFTKADVRSHVFQRLDNILLCLPPPFSFLNENHLVQPTAHTYSPELTHWTSEYVSVKSISKSSRCFWKPSQLHCSQSNYVCADVNVTPVVHLTHTWNQFQDSSCTQGRWGAKVRLQVTSSSQGYTETNNHLDSYSQLWPIKSS